MIEKLNDGHLNQLLLDLNQYDEFWNEKILKDECENPNSKYFVLTEDNAIIGFGGLWFNIDEAHIMNIAVKKENRRNGYGSEILKYLIGIAREQNKNCITLEVRSDNIPAIGLYEKFGFEKVGNRKKYYGNDDAIIMTKFFEK